MSSAAEGTSCSLDTDGAALAVTGAGVIDLGVYSSLSDADISNSGEIADTYYGLYLNNGLAGDLTNRGSISAGGSSGSNAYAAGIYVNGDITGTISNSGNIDAHASSSDYVNADGILAGSLSGTLTNSGAISASAESGSEVNAVGVDISWIEGTLINSGSISARAADGYWVEATGLEVEELDGTISNGGSISANAESGYNAAATGVDFDEDLDGELVNSGTISASAGSGYGFNAYAVGINVGEDLDGSLTNTGNIIASAGLSTGTGYALDAYAAGIFAEDLDGQLTNSGNITAKSLSQGNDAEAGGILIGYNYSSSSGPSVSLFVLAEEEELPTQLHNSGVITVSATSEVSEDGPSDYPDARAIGVFYGENLYGDENIQNSSTGKILVSADAALDAYAQGLVFGTYESYYSNSSSGSDYYYSASGTENLVNGLFGRAQLTNDGVIAVNATAGRDADAAGILVGGLQGSSSSGVLALAAEEIVRPSLVNNGTITVVASAARDARAAGIEFGETSYYGEYFSSGVTFHSSGCTSGCSYSNSGPDSGYGRAGIANAQLINNGKINVSAVSEQDEAYAVGILVGNVEDDAELTNKGQINVLAKGLDEATASGIVVNDVTDATLTNSGSIVVTALSSDYEAYAYGVITEDVEFGSVLNENKITVSAQGEDYVSAYGISADDLRVEAQLVNDGTISVQARSLGYSASAYGIAVDNVGVDGYDAAITNNGSISAIASGAESAWAYGIDVSYLDEDGVITNSAGGKIIATAVARQSSASAWGVLVSDGVAGAITNSGTITVTAEAAADSVADAYAYGIDVSYVEGGSITNEATLTVKALADYGSASAYGILGDSVEDGEIVNSGTISLTAVSAKDEAYAYAIDMDEMDGQASITNEESGVIRASAVGDQYVSAYGIITDDLNDNAVISNSGTIEAVAIAANSSASAYGIATGRLYGSASISNGGIITAMAVDNSELGNDAWGYGMYLNGILDNARVSNDGDIIVTAKADNAQASAYGIYVSGPFGSDQPLVNTGKIVVSGNDAGDVYSVYISGGSHSYATSVSDGLVDNQGTMTGGVNLNGGSFYNCFSGCTYLGSNNVSLVNSGSITTWAHSDSYVSGDYTQAAGGSLTFIVKNGDEAFGESGYAQLQVDGEADFTDSNTIKVVLHSQQMLQDEDYLDDVVYADDGLTAPDGLDVSDSSIFWDFETVLDGNSLDLIAHYSSASEVLSGSGLNLSPSLAALVDNVLSQGGAEEFSGIAAALNSVSSVEQLTAVLEQIGPALAGAAGQASRIASAGASNAINARVAETRGASSGDAFNNGAVWVKPFLGIAEQDAASGVSGFDVDTTGFVLGVDGEVGNATRLGVALASAQSEVASNFADLDIAVTQLTMYGSYNFDDRTALDVDLGYSMNEFESSRRVLGSIAAADYDGEQIGFGASLSRSYKLNDKSALVPSLGLRFTQVSIDGYTEVGSGANLTVADSDEDALMIAAKGTYELTMANKGVFNATLGVAYDDVDAASATSTLSGTGPTFVSNGVEPESTVLLGGLGYRYVTSKNLEVNAAYDVESRDEFLGQTVSVKFKMPF